MVISVGGLSAFSATDYPGCFSAVVFCQGCPWHCRYCHNPDLIPVGEKTSINWEDVHGFLQTRKNLLDAVVFSGGEPTLQLHLIKAIEQVKLLGFRIGLHTSGSCFNGLKKVLPLLDWVGIDIKAPDSKYQSVTKIPKSGNSAWKSLVAVIESDVDHEVRTTVHPCLLSRDDIIKVAKSLSALGVKKYVLQEFRPTGCLDQELNATMSQGYLDQNLIEELTPLFASFEVRRA